MKLPSGWETITFPASRNTETNGKVSAGGVAPGVQSMAVCSRFENYLKMKFSTVADGLFGQTRGRILALLYSYPVEREKPPGRVSPATCARAREDFEAD
jgi:hypothetical protein